jgi:hypothetical protein
MKEVEWDSNRSQSEKWRKKPKNPPKGVKSWSKKKMCIQQRATNKEYLLCGQDEDEN